jgi:hypothetical protein
MDSKKLAKIIKLIVEHELKRQLPAITSLIKEEVTRELLKTNKISTKKIVEEIDPFALASSMLEKSRSEEHREVIHEEETVHMKRLSKNPMLNDILNHTKPFREGPSLNENINYNDQEEWPTMGFNDNIAPGGVEGMKAQMSAKLGHGGNNTVPPINAPKGGLGVTTGLPYLDRVLNRDNSTLVAKFKTRK